MRALYPLSPDSVAFIKTKFIPATLPAILSGAKSTEKVKASVNFILTQFLSILGADNLLKMLSVAFGSSHPHTVASAIACYTMLIKERKKAFETSTLVSLAGLVTLSLSAQSADIIREAFKLLGVLLPALGPTDGDPLLPQALAAIGNGAGAVRSERRAFLKKIIKRFGYVVFIFILFCFIFYAGLLFMIFFFIFYLVFLFYLLYGQCFFVNFFDIYLRLLKLCC